MLHFLFVVPILNSGIHVKRAQHRKPSDTCSTIFHSMINEINSQSGCFPIHVHCTILIVALKWQLDKINVLWARAWPNNGLEGGMLTVSITQSFIFSCLCIFCFVLCFKYHFFFKKQWKYILPLGYNVLQIECNFLQGVHNVCYCREYISYFIGIWICYPVVECSFFGFYLFHSSFRAFFMG